MAGTKRKATGANNGASGSKRARTNSHRDAKALVKAILVERETYPVPDDDGAVLEQLVKLAEYARDLEEEIQSAPQGSPKTMTPEQLQSAVAKLRKAALSGITKQMSWKPSCKTGTAKWAYDGVCTDPLVFGTLMGLGGPPTFKSHKMPVDQFGELFGGIQASVRYDYLYLTGSHVNIRWSDSGEFKFSGTYGKFQS